MICYLCKTPSFLIERHQISSSKDVNKKRTVYEKWSCEKGHPIVVTEKDKKAASCSICSFKIEGMTERYKKRSVKLIICSGGCLSILMKSLTKMQKA